MSIQLRRAHVLHMWTVKRCARDLLNLAHGDAIEQEDWTGTRILVSQNCIAPYLPSINTTALSDQLEIEPNQTSVRHMLLMIEILCTRHCEQSTRWSDHTRLKRNVHNWYREGFVHRISHHFMLPYCYDHWILARYKQSQDTFSRLFKTISVLNKCYQTRLTHSAHIGAAEMPHITFIITRCNVFLANWQLS